MLLFSEDALLTAIETKIFESGYFTTGEVGIEYDQLTPNLIGHSYVAICPSSWSKGEDAEGGAVYDHRISVDVHVIVRVQDTPKDRVRNKFLAGLKTLNTACAHVNSVVDFKYDVLSEANAQLLLLESDSNTRTHGFIEPLRFDSLSRPVAVASSFFSGGNVNPVSGLSRTFKFSNARRIVPRNA